MRWLWLIMVSVALTGAVGAFLFQRAGERREEQMVSQARETVNTISQRMRYLKALEQLELNEFGWPELIDPNWFGQEPPRNRMLASRHPWMEVASPLEYTLDHPVQRVAINERLAGLWYNPARGIIRARVPQTVSDEKTIELYNRVNGVVVTELFDSRPRRQILEDILREEDTALEVEEHKQSGVTVRRRRDADEPAVPESSTEEKPHQPDESAQLEDEDDPAGPVRDAPTDIRHEHEDAQRESEPPRRGEQNVNDVR